MQVRVPCGYNVDVKAIHLPVNADAVRRITAHIQGEALRPVADFLRVGGREATAAEWTTLEAAAQRVDSPVVKLVLGPEACTHYVLGRRGSQPTAQELQGTKLGLEFVLPPHIHDSRSPLLLPAACNEDLMLPVAERRGEFFVLDVDPVLVVPVARVQQEGEEPTWWQKVAPYLPAELLAEMSEIQTQSCS